MSKPNRQAMVDGTYERGFDAGRLVGERDAVARALKFANHFLLIVADESLRDDFHIAFLRHFASADGTRSRGEDKTKACDHAGQPCPTKDGTPVGDVGGCPCDHCYPRARGIPGVLIVPSTSEGEPAFDAEVIARDWATQECSKTGGGRIWWAGLVAKDDDEPELNACDCLSTLITLLRDIDRKAYERGRRER